MRTYCRVDIKESLRVWVFSCFLLGPLALKEVLLPQYWLNYFRFLSGEINLRSSLFVELLSVFKRSTWTSPSMTNASAIYAPSHFILIADKMWGKSPQMSHFNSKINVVEMRPILWFSNNVLTSIEQKWISLHQYLVIFEKLKIADKQCYQTVWFVFSNDLAVLHSWISWLSENLIHDISFLL